MNTIFIPSPGVTFLAPSGETLHLHFVLTTPLKKDGLEEVLVVNITTLKVDEDYTLSPGDHPFITHKSYINYPRAKKMSVEGLEQKSRQGKIIKKGVVSRDIVKFICEGLRKSRHSTKRSRDFCKEACKKAEE